MYGLSSMLQFSQFVWPLNYSVWDVFNNFLLIDATDRSENSSDQKRFFIALSLYFLSFFANTPFKIVSGRSSKSIQRLLKVKYFFETSVYFIIFVGFIYYSHFLLKLFNLGRHLLTTGLNSLETALKNSMYSRYS